MPSTRNRLEIGRASTSTVVVECFTQCEGSGFGVQVAKTLSILSRLLAIGIAIGARPRAGMAAKQPAAVVVEQV
jgi:hypothetical protein